MYIIGMSLLLIILISFLLNGNLEAHPGHRDEKGCHINSDSGHKHCHDVKEKKSAKKKKEKESAPRDVASEPKGK